MLYKEDLKCHKILQLKYERNLIEVMQVSHPKTLYGIINNDTELKKVTKLHIISNNFCSTKRNNCIIFLVTVI